MKGFYIASEWGQSENKRKGEILPAHQSGTARPT